MKKFSFIILALLLMVNTAFATTSGKVVMTKVSSSTGISPVEEDSDISDVLGTSVSIGVPTTIIGALSATTLNAGGIYCNGTNCGIGTLVPGATLDVVGNIRASTVSTVSITSTPYTISSGQNGVYFTYTDAAAGTINLPALSGLSAGFTVTIARQVPQSLTIAANGANTFPNTLSSLEMRGQNIGTITLMKAGSFWTIVNETPDCIIGQACWYSNMIYAGTLNGHQYFTTPGGCNNSATPTCNSTDSLTLAYADNATGGNKEYGSTGNATDEYYGKTQTATLATFSDTLAATFCHNMTYDGNSDNDWYLPAKMEWNLLYQNKVAIGGFFTSNATYQYWSSTEYVTTFAWYFYSAGYLGFSTKSTSYYVRCVRRY